MTDTAVEQREAQAAFKLDRRIKDAINGSREALWELAEALYEFQEARAWLLLDHDDLSEWLADPDVSLTSATFYRLVKAWGKLVVQKQIEPARLKALDLSKVAIVTNAISAGTTTVDEALSDAEALGARDLRTKYYGPKHPAEDDDDNRSDGSVPNVGDARGDDEDEAEDLDTANTPPTSGQDDLADSDEVVEAEVVEPTRALTIDDLVVLAQKRWHRKPDAEDVEAWLAKHALELPTIPALPWDELYDAFASRAENPRIPKTTLGSLLEWHTTLT